MRRQKGNDVEESLQPVVYFHRDHRTEIVYHTLFLKKIEQIFIKKFSSIVNDIKRGNGPSSKGLTNRKVLTEMA